MYVPGNTSVASDLQWRWKFIQLSSHKYHKCWISFKWCRWKIGLLLSTKYWIVCWLLDITSSDDLWWYWKVVSIFQIILV